MTTRSRLVVMVWELWRVTRAETAWKLGKRYVQDQPLDWGCAVERENEDLTSWHAAGPTTKQARKP